MGEQAKHTPGPWLAATKASSIVGLPVVAPQAMGRMICSVTHAGPAAACADYNAESEANARLIATAPDLLTEAREICAILDNYRADTGEEPCFDHEAIGEEVARRHDNLTAAIAKATGAAS